MKFAKDHPLLILLLLTPTIIIVLYLLFFLPESGSSQNEDWVSKVFLVLLGGFLSTITTVALFYYQKEWEYRTKQTEIIDLLIISFDMLTSEFDNFVKKLDQNHITDDFYAQFKNSTSIAEAMRSVERQQRSAALYYNNGFKECFNAINNYISLFSAGLVINNMSPWKQENNDKRQKAYEAILELSGNDMWNRMEKARNAESDYGKLLKVANDMLKKS